MFRWSPLRASPNKFNNYDGVNTITLDAVVVTEAVDWMTTVQMNSNLNFIVLLATVKGVAIPLCILISLHHSG